MSIRGVWQGTPNYVTTRVMNTFTITATIITIYGFNYSITTTGTVNMTSPTTATY